MMIDKVMAIIDRPVNCCECPFRFNYYDLHIGNFTYQKLNRCKLEPKNLDEDEGDVVYLNDFMLDKKAPWWPLQEVPTEYL